MTNFGAMIQNAFKDNLIGMTLFVQFQAIGNWKWSVWGSLWFVCDW